MAHHFWNVFWNPYKGLVCVSQDPRRTVLGLTLVATTALLYATSIGLTAIAISEQHLTLPQPQHVLEMVDETDEMLVVTTEEPPSPAWKYWKSCVVTIPVFLAGWIAASIACRMQAKLFGDPANPPAAEESMGTVAFALMVPTVLLLLLPDFILALCSLARYTDPLAWDFASSENFTSSPVATAVGIALLVLYSLWTLMLLTCAHKVLSRGQMRTVYCIGAALICLLVFDVVLSPCL